MKKKMAIISGCVIATMLAVPSGIVLANHGVEGLDAYIKALEYGLLGLEKYFEFIVDLFKAVVG